MYKAVIDNQEYSINKLSIKWKLNSSEEFDVDIYTQITNDVFSFRGKDVQIYKNRELIISGFIDKKPLATIAENSLSTVSIKCLGELGRLVCYKSKFSSHYQDSPILTILTDLLSVTNGEWVLEVVNFLEPSISTTLDLRTKETLFSQITETVKSAPNINLRYGGFNGTNHVLQVGDFGDRTYYIDENRNLLELSIEAHNEKEFRSVAAYGDVSAGGKITLSDALINPLTLESEHYGKYIIEQDFDGEYILTNTETDAFCNLRKSFNVIKTKNDEVPTLEQISEAGYALFLKAVRFLESNEEIEKYSVSFLNELIPKLGQKLFINSIVSEPVYNDYGNKVDSVEIFRISKSLKITSLNLNFESQHYPEGLQTDNLYNLSATINSGQGYEEIDNELILYEKLEKYDEFDDANGVPTIFSPVLVSSTTHGSSSSADCTINTPNDAKTFVVVTPTPPTGATDVSVVYAVSPSTSIIGSVTPPASVGSNLTACIKPAVGNFPPPPDQPITLTVYWLFT
jgi:hypothetical protein